jgi:excisionase family DNA binding protein
MRQRKEQIMDNQQLREMARIALENWLFDQDTDPDGDVQRGLAYLAEPGDWDDGIIAARVSGPNDWDGLREWAAFLGQDDLRPVDIITLTEAHDISGVGRSTLNEWAREGELSAWQSGRIWLTTRQALSEAIERLRPQKGE